MSNHTRKMTQVPIEINMMGTVKLLETLHTVLNVKILVFHVKMLVFQTTLFQ